MNESMELTKWGSRDYGAFASHQTRPGSLPAGGDMWVAFFDGSLALYNAPGVLNASRVFRFPSSSKINISNFQFCVDGGPMKTNYG